MLTSEEKGNEALQELDRILETASFVKLASQQNTAQLLAQNEQLAK